MFDRFESRYTLLGKLITKTALHIGAGTSLAVVGSDNPIVRDSNGLPYIPGSSFKGPLRSLIESIVRALSPGGRQEPWACDPLAEKKWCIPSENMDQWQLEVRNNGRTQGEVDQYVWKESCTVCRIFGSPWLASKVKVADLYLTQGSNWGGRVEVRDGVAIDRDTETVSGRRKYDFEVVPRETAFNLTLRVDNASDEELGLLFLGLREFTKGGAWVGGNTSRGLGQVQIEWDRFEAVVGRKGLLSYLQNGMGMALDKEEERQAFIKEKTQKFLRILMEGGNEHVQKTAQPNRD